MDWWTGWLTRDKLVALQAVFQPRPEEHVGLVQQEHGVPQATELKVVRQGRLNGGRVGAQQTGAGDEERDAGSLGHWGNGLALTGSLGTHMSVFRGVRG